MWNQQEDLERRRFISGAGMAAAALFGAPATGRAQRATRRDTSSSPEPRLANMTLDELRDRCRHELFDVLVPFWDRHGVDHARGGFLCGLDYDGSLQQADKFHWFQGRGIWVFSYLYNHFRQEPRYLEIARKAKDFMLSHGRQTDAWASGDDEARELAFETAWSLDEVLVATIKVLERHDAPWAARYFTLAHEALDTWHSRRRAGQPAGYLLFSDRRHSPQAHVTRQDNYHHLRALMLCLQSIDRIAGRPRSSGPAGR